jgi:hypothetical protein
LFLLIVFEPNKHLGRSRFLFTYQSVLPIALFAAALFGAKNAESLISFATSNFAFKSMPSPAVELISCARAKRAGDIEIKLGQR